MTFSEFRYPIREVDIWFGDEAMTEDDQASSLELNQQSLEDYISNQLPNVYIQQADLGSGVIDPAQLATGTAGTGKAPISQGTSAPAWTDVTLQSEYDAGIGGQFTNAAALQRGRITTGMTGTNTVFSQTFGSTFAVVPRVTATIESGAGIGMFPTLTAVNTTSFAGFVFANSSTTATLFIHWHAVKA